MKQLLIGLLALGSIPAFATTIETVMDPTVPGSSIPFSMRSSPDGICKVLGYEYAIDNSIAKAFDDGTQKRTFKGFLRGVSRPDDVQQIPVEEGDIKVVFSPVKANAMKVDKNGKIIKQIYGSVVGSISCAKP